MASWFSSGSLREVEIVAKDDRIELRFGPVSVHMSPAEARRFQKKLANAMEER
ncbi:hypothetical protein MYP14_04660 [Rhodococcus pyridinivorans]|uniref:hypothetical protein n=1 Tax=Rhodococcus pyridinivorans TaxID=103816 RepID=UPI001FFE8147|nr:hypothetical protein [Rhodococcus pyridinivorans]UPK64658.1 hypothetical protein MYP14_04660 [Rhodococcus pyridinivorans]